VRWDPCKTNLKNLFERSVNTSTILNTLEEWRLPQSPTKQLGLKALNYEYFLEGGGAAHCDWRAISAPTEGDSLVLLVRRAHPP